MLLDHIEFLLGQLVRLIQDLVRDPNLAEIVQIRAEPDRRQLALVTSKLLGDCHRIRSHALAVTDV